MTALHGKFSPDVTPKFDKTLLGSVQRAIDPAKWDAVVDIYEAGKFKETIIGLLDYTDPELITKHGNPEQTKFTIPHGSAVLNITLNETDFTVRAPFLKISDTHAVPLLRQVAEINLALNLSHIALENDLLVFKFGCPLELCEPYKTYDVLREICVYADDYDDLFIQKFGAQRMHQPVIKRFQEKHTEYARQKVQQYITEALAYVDYFEKRRNFEYCLDIIFITLAKIDYYCVPQGMLRTEIGKNIVFLQDQDIDMMDKMRKGAACLKQLQKYDRRDFIKDLYVAETFISMRYNFTNDLIETIFQNTVKLASEEIANRDFQGAALTLQHAYMNLFYQYAVPEDIKGIITEALEKSAGKQWEEASTILWKAMEDVLDHDSQDKKGFWRSLFGRKK